MISISVQELLEAGAHFGHRVSRWHPKMGPYIYGKRNSVHIIDLRETVKGLVKAHRFLSRVVGQGQDVVFVGTKRAARLPIATHAQRAKMPYVNERWLGGTLTNYATILSRLRRLEELEQWEQTGRIQTFSKKMVSTLHREKERILRNLEGIRTMKRLPGALILVDPKREENALKEARRMGIPTVALVDTDTDPSLVDIVVPGNDDAVKVVDIFARVLADGILAGKGMAGLPAAAESAAPAAIPAAG